MVGAGHLLGWWAMGLNTRATDLQTLADRSSWPSSCSYLSERLARIERAQWALLLMLLSLSVGALVSVLLR